MKVENIVCSGTFNQNLDLKRLSSLDDRIEYGKNKYPGAYLKFDNHSITIYSTGKYIMPGMRSFDEMFQTFEKVKEILASFCNVNLFEKPEVRNMVCSSNIGHELNLETLLVELISRDLDAVYEPEAFPGLIYKAQSCTYNIFQSGKFLILGCTTEISAQQCDDELHSLLTSV